jgi:hypothetical protein
MSLRVGYRFKDLKAAGFVSSRGDLNRKQRLHGFPRPIKTGDRSAWWDSDVVDAWLEARAALRDKPAIDPEHNPTDQKPPKTRPTRERTRKAAVEIADTS